MRRTQLMLLAFAATVALTACGKSDPPADMGTPFDLSLSDTGSDAGGPADAGVDLGSAVVETPRPELEVLLADREVSFSNGESERFAVEVPEGTVSLTVSVTGPQGYFYALSRWVNGDGETLVPNTWLEDDSSAPTVCTERTCPLQIASSESAFAAQLPNNAKVQVVPGTHNIGAYAFSLTGFAMNPADGIMGNVRVTAKKLPTPPETGVLDMNFYFSGARGWTADTVAEDADFQAVLTQLQEIYDQVGLKLGTITYTDIPAEYGVVENVFTRGPDLEELFSLSAGQPRTAINVFMIEQIFFTNAGNEFAIILGVSGGIPGPPFAGTPRSGVVISSEGDPRAPVPTAAVIAHEVGHHLGLFHTTEAMSPLHDPIEDTPENDTTMLMHATGSGETLSPTQGLVMRHNVWVNHGDAE